MTNEETHMDHNLDVGATAPRVQERTRSAQLQTHDTTRAIRLLQSLGFLVLEKLGDEWHEVSRLRK